MKTNFPKLMLFLVVLFCPCPADTVGQDLWNNNIGHSAWEIALPPGERQRLLALWNSIGDDLKNDKNPFAGTYVKGGYNWGYFLRWSTNKGFVVVPYFDQNLITDYGYGNVKFIDPSQIVFTPDKQLRRGGRGLDEMPRMWTAIWNYLVPVSSLREFGQFHAGRGNFNEFNGPCCEFVPSFLAQRTEGPISATVDPKYLKFIKQPLVAEITSVGRRRIVPQWGYTGQYGSTSLGRTSLTPIRLSIGRQQGVYLNMLFTLVGQPRTQYVQVSRVYQNQSDGYVVRTLNDGKEAEAEEKSLPPVVAGGLVTTNPYGLAKLP